MPKVFDSKPSLEHVCQGPGKVRQILIKAGLGFLDLRFWALFPSEVSGKLPCLGKVTLVESNGISGAKTSQLQNSIYIGLATVQGRNFNKQSLICLKDYIWLLFIEWYSL